MKTLISPLIHAYSYELTGNEKTCLLSSKSVNGYLPIGAIMPQIDLSIQLAVMRDKKPLTPGSFNIEYIIEDCTFGYLHETLLLETSTPYLTQEQITTSIETCEAILPRPYLYIHGHFCAIIFFQENKRTFVAQFTTSEPGNCCYIFELNEKTAQRIIRKQHTIHNRVVFLK